MSGATCVCLFCCCCFKPLPASLQSRRWLLPASLRRLCRRPLLRVCPWCSNVLSNLLRLLWMLMSAWLLRQGRQLKPVWRALQSSGLHCWPGGRRLLHLLPLLLLGLLLLLLLLLWFLLLWLLL